MIKKVIGVVGVSLLLLTLIPTAAARVDLQIFGGIGIKLSAAVCCGDSANIEYSIEVRGQTVNGTAYVGTSNSYWSERFYFFKLISPITVTLKANGDELTKNGILIGIFVLI